MDQTVIYLFIKFRLKDSEIVATTLCVRNISKDISVDNMKKTSFNGYVSDSSRDYGFIAVNNILDIQKYLMKKNDIIKIKCLNKVYIFYRNDFFNGYALKCVSMNNQECKITSEVINVISNKPSFYPYSIELNKSSRIYNNINNPCDKLWLLMLLKT